MDLEPEVRKLNVKKMSSEIAEVEGHLISKNQYFSMASNRATDTLISQMKWRFEKLNEISDDFEFLSGHSILTMDITALKKCAADCALKCSKDLDLAEIVCKIGSLKFEAILLMQNIHKATHLEVLQMLHRWGIVPDYPNIEIALRIFLTISMTAALCKLSFSKLKSVKNYL